MPFLAYNKHRRLNQQSGKRQEQQGTSYVEEGMEHSDLRYGHFKPFHKRHIVETTPEKQQYRKDNRARYVKQ